MRFALWMIYFAIIEIAETMGAESKPFSEPFGIFVVFMIVVSIIADIRDASDLRGNK